MTKVIEFLRLLDEKDPAFGAMKLVGLSIGLMGVVGMAALVVKLWILTLGVCT